MQDGKVKRKVGRPIAYSGDPFSPDLEPEQRRIILRRIANRESARRVRARRQDELDRLGQRVCPLNSMLTSGLPGYSMVCACWQLGDLESLIAEQPWLCCCGAEAPWLWAGARNGRQQLSPARQAESI